MLELDRREGPKEEVLRLNAWLSSWAPDWLEELFCDLFATFTLGPAYAWSNCHVCLKLATNPFETPLQVQEEHPPNAARMDIMLIGLKRLGFKAEAGHAAVLWDAQVGAAGHQADMAYRQCFAPGVLADIATSAFDAFEETGLKEAQPSDISGVALCLNQAWERFWSDPSGIGDWETQAIKHLQTWRVTLTTLLRIPTVPIGP